MYVCTYNANDDNSYVSAMLILHHNSIVASNSLWNAILAYGSSELFTKPLAMDLLIWNIRNFVVWNLLKVEIIQQFTEMCV